MPADAWLTVAASSYASLVPVHATLNGCIEGWRSRKATAAEAICVWMTASNRASLLSK